MIKKNQTATIIAGAVALSGSAFAGEVITPTPEVTNNGSWCDGFKNVGKFYSDDSSPYIQSLKFFGRFQAQYAYIDGDDVNGDSFNEGIDEVRRLRFGAELKFLNGFKLKGNVNLVDDDANSQGGREFAYQNFDQLKLSYTKKDILGFDKLGLTYGRHKVAVGAEAHTSSKKIKTVERSALSNRIFDDRWTGFTLDFERGNWEGTLGYFSQDEDDALGSLSNGSAIYLSSSHDISSGNILFDFFHNLDGGEEDERYELASYEWAASLAYTTKVGNWDLLVNVAFGDNGDSDYESNPDRQGNFWGLVVMPSTYIIEDRLEFVARYAYQGSEEDEGIRTNSRYFRDDAVNADINGGRGDAHHSIYLGLNYYFCGHNSKVLLGVEYDNLDSPDGDADATTLWAAYRTYF